MQSLPKNDDARHAALICNLSDPKRRTRGRDGKGMNVRKVRICLRFEYQWFEQAQRCADPKTGEMAVGMLVGEAATGVWN